MNYNELSEIPYFGEPTSNITLLSLVHNTIPEINAEQLQVYLSLENLDLSFNLISEIKASSFPRMQLKYLNLSNNRITTLEAGCLDNLSSSLMVVKLNRNRISAIPPKIFKLPHVQFLELKRNRIKTVESLTFQGLESLKSLKMQRNGISKLMDGAFFGLDSIEELELEHNNLTEVNKGWLYGLRSLQQLYVSQNAINRISPDAWEFCQRLSELDLSYNQLTRLDESAFVGLSLLEKLNLGDNRVSHIADGVFKGLSNLQILDMRNNEISWAIEDASEAFAGLNKLSKLILQGNQIKSIIKKAFSGLEALEHLDLNNNAIMSVQEDAFSQTRLRELMLNTSSLLCDCQLKWLPQWLSDSHLEQAVNVSCAHPEWLAGHSVLNVDPEDFVCDDFPKPQIRIHPETTVALRGVNVTLTCTAVSSSDSPMSTAWRKDSEVLYDAEIENFARYRQQGGEVLEYTTVLHLFNVNFTDEGKYQCIVTNHFGSNYSNKAKLTVNEEMNLPADIPSYLSSQGTLSEPQEGYSNSEAGSHQQLMPPASGYVHKGTDGGTGPLVICSDCYDNANIYSRTREYCPYAYITEDDPLDQTLSNLMVQMPKETYPAHVQHETSTLDNLIADREMSVFLTNHDRISEKKLPSQQTNEPFQLPLWGINKDLGLSRSHCLHQQSVHEAPRALRSEGVLDDDREQAASPRPCHRLCEHNFDFNRTRNMQDYSETT
ncbi:leucine-rich repeats and immunoglobulin-like domains protein 2 isoform X2 [Alligator sinensis]|uniref:leucine-rich repeats and immunoglobulin-like domains protein 2 isoform X2 n=1 Tax=Alligator sinensis TaxID=38654 RepID=UPI000D721538|nr:leucine-rich repeats and immunoglobulin-like domains protein 2 isoform X2 [Alligator sinensis]